MGTSTRTNAPPLEPDWTGFVLEFTDPTAGQYQLIYNATATAAQASTPLILQHWNNLTLGGLAAGMFAKTSDPVQAFQNSAEYLNLLLQADGNPLTQETKDAWVSLAAAYNIPLALS